jgi:hypothetical protein
MIVLPASQSALALVDWLETSLLTQVSNRISDTAIIDIFSEADFQDPDAQLAAVIQVFRSRIHALGEAYPIRRDGQGFSRSASWRQKLPYSFMLFASLNQSYVELAYTGGSANRPAELFEMLALRALEKYLDCTVVRIGAPRRAPVPAAFSAALDYTAAELREILGQRDLEDHNSGDDGVDLIGWRTFGDSRASQALIFAQCAIGTDWRDKRDGVNLDLWRRHIDWHSHPLKGFAVPFHHEPGRPWRETATRAGIIFDRLRIARLVQLNSLNHEFRRNVIAWCIQRTRAISALNV